MLLPKPLILNARFKAVQVDPFLLCFMKSCWVFYTQSHPMLIGVCGGDELVMS
jgi:hypothetical protein